MPDCACRGRLINRSFGPDLGPIEGLSTQNQASYGTIPQCHASAERHLMSCPSAYNIITVVPPEVSSKVYLQGNFGGFV